MKAGKWIGIGVLITLGTVITGMAAVWLISGFGFWRMPMLAAPWNRWPMPDRNAPCNLSEFGMKSGMMGSWRQPRQCDVGTQRGMMGGNSLIVDGTGDQLSIEEAYSILQKYVTNLYDGRLEITEVYEFDKNFYAVLREKDTDTGAMELLVNKWQGTINPEMGPNMMWNAKYGMHGRGRMMVQTTTTGTNSLSEETALNIAQQWLDENLPGTATAGHADPFYGYYTFHYINDGVIAGMFSVHGTTGQVWYHTWHGDFIQMIEGEDMP